MHSALGLVDGDLRRIAWWPGQGCPPSLARAAAQRLDASGCLAADDDQALPLLQRLAEDEGHSLQVDPAVWPLLAADRDARGRLQRLEAAYPDGPASAALQALLAAPLPLYQAEGALWSVVSGRALLADERGLGKGVQAIAATQLWRRHFGLQRVLVLCAPAQRAAWQRAWRRFAGLTAQVVEGGLHQRQTLWSDAAELRIVSPEALTSDAAHVARWAPELVIVDEPQRLALDAACWSALRAADAPQALVLCGAPLDERPALLEALVDWLDPQRQGPLAALRALQAARSSGTPMADDAVEQVSTQLSRLLLQRQREDLEGQLPPLLFSERLLTLAPAQREAHDRALDAARALLAGWQRSGYLSDANQWRLASALRAMRQACRREDPADPHGPLAEPVLLALSAQLDDWADTGVSQVAVLCGTEADRDQLARRLPARTGLQLLLAGQQSEAAPEAVLRIGVPWQLPREPIGNAGPAQQWMMLVARHSIDAGLFDTLARRERGAVPSADGSGFLAGAALTAWLQSLQQAISAIDGDAPQR